MASLLASSPVRIPCKAVLFDMDGILISSTGSVERSWTKWALMRGVDPESAIRAAHGCRAIETVALLRPDLDSVSQLNLIEVIELADGVGLAVLPGVLNLLNALPTDRWTVVTSATERLARLRLAACGIPAPLSFIHAGCVAEGKPNPEPFLAGAELLGYAPQECVVLEDAPSGVAAGRAAGCTVVATPFSHSMASLAAAHYLVEDLTGMAVAILPGSQGLLLSFKPIAS
jgi:sugar-phosphatase